MAVPRTLLVSSSRSRLQLTPIFSYARRTSTSSPKHTWPPHPSGAGVANDEVARLAASRRRPLTLTDLVK